MKIVKIEVKKLFGIFDHEIPLSSDGHITIIIGPNGYGKTILLTMIHAIFSKQRFKLHQIPFEKLIITFDDNSHLTINRTSFEKENLFKLEYFRESSETNTDNNRKKDLPTESNQPYDSIPTRLIETQRLLLESYPEKQSDEQVINLFGTEFKKISPGNVDFSKNHQRNSQQREEPNLLMPLTVKNYSNELVTAIQTKLAEYGTLSQSLDRSYPTRLFKEVTGVAPTVSQLKEQLMALEAERSRLIAAGLLEKEEAIDFKDMDKIDENKINALSVYVSDVKQKLAVFNGLTDKIELLLGIINRLFQYKTLSISKLQGFVFETADGQKIEPAQLSSGEQHELVLIYQLLFKVKPGTLLLIDEPELSLHVAWQQQFLTDLEKITQLVGFDVLIATHSPQIIHDRWDLTVELKGPEL